MIINLIKYNKWSLGVSSHFVSASSGHKRYCSFCSIGVLSQPKKLILGEDNEKIKLCLTKW